MEIGCVDLFCGAGGLTHGLLRSGVKVTAGIDLDESCRYAFESNNKPAKFFAADVSALTHLPPKSFGVTPVRLALSERESSSALEGVSASGGPDDRRAVSASETSIVARMIAGPTGQITGQPARTSVHLYARGSDAR